MLACVSALRESEAAELRWEVWGCALVSMATMGGSRAVVMVVLLLLLCVATGFLRGVCAQQPAPAPVAGGVGAPYVAMAPQSPTMAPAPAPGPLWPDCEGVDIVYVTSYTEKIYPYLNDTPWLQPYKFEASVTLTNMGYSTVEGWAMGIQYQHHEVSVSEILFPLRKQLSSCFPTRKCFL